MKIPSREEGDFIEGIDQYCDRWCERCPMNTRCRHYAMECAQDALSVDNEGDDGGPLNLEECLTMPDDEEPICFNEIVDDWSSHPGVAEGGGQPEETIWEELDDEEMMVYLEERERIDRETRNTSCVKVLDRYLGEVNCWMNEWDSLLDELDDENGILQDSRDVIQWDLFQISIKLRRAIGGKLQEDPFFHEEDTLGSAKVALIGLDRSRKAWEHIRSLLAPQQAASVTPLIRLLADVTSEVESAIPGARSFRRPGFET